MGQGYADTAKAAAEQKKRIWYGYVGAGIIWAALTAWSRGTWIEPLMWWGTFIGWVVSTIVCLWLSARAGRQEQRVRSAVLQEGLSPRELWERPLPPSVEEDIRRRATDDDGAFSRVRADALREAARRERAEREGNGR